MTDLVKSNIEIGGKGFENGELSIKDLYKIGVGQTDFAKTSGKQELYESILANSF